MTKKRFLIVLIILSLMILTACSQNQNAKKPADLNSFLITEGVALTHDMKELASSKEYMNLVSPSKTLEQMTDKMASQDYNLPQNAYLIKLPDDVLLGAMRAFAPDLNLPDNIKEKLKYKINGSTFANLMNAGYGSEMIAATSVTTWGQSYIEPKDWSDNMLLLLEYPGEFSSIVSFVQSGDGVISASAIFVKNGEQDIIISLQEFIGKADFKADHYEGSTLEDLLKK